jgi:hypothetical protein
MEDNKQFYNNSCEDTQEGTVLGSYTDITDLGCSVIQWLVLNGPDWASAIPVFRQ